MIDAKRLLSDGLKVNALSIDWISVTAKKDVDGGYSAHPSLHDWENWNDCNGVNGYTTGSKHTTGVRTYNNSQRLDMGKHTVYSGGALRRVEEYNGTSAYDVMDYHSQCGHSFTRIDLAVDFFNSCLEIDRFENDFMSGYADTQLKSASKVKNLTSDGYTLYIGSRKKIKKLVTVYDKAAEQGLSGDWIRVETRVMGKPATVAAETIRLDKESKGRALMGVVKSVINFPKIKEWCELADNVDKAEIGTISGEKGDVRKWLHDQCVPALVKEIILDPDFADEFNEWVRLKLIESGGYIG